MKRIYAILLTIVLTMTSSSIYASPVYFSSGHSDVGMAGEDGLELHLHVHEGAVLNGVVDENEHEFGSDEVVIVVPEGAYNGNLWLLAQSHTTHIDAPFLGVGSGEAQAGVYVDDKINFSLVSVVSAPAGGDFILWQTDLFGSDDIFMSTQDGVSSPGYVSVGVGSHSHYNWGFTTAGIYELQFEASANLTAGGMDSDIATFSFQVVPEPASMLSLLAGIGVLARRKRA